MKAYYYRKTIDVVFSVNQELDLKALLEEAEFWLDEDIKCNGLKNSGTEPVIKEIKSIDDVPPRWRDDNVLIWGDYNEDVSLREVLDGEYQLYLKLKKKYEK